MKLLTDGNVVMVGQVPHLVEWSTRTVGGVDRSRNWWSHGFPCDLLAAWEEAGVEIPRGAWTTGTVARRFVGTGT